MPIADDAANLTIDALAGSISHVSLHSEWSTVGANELPGVTRQPVTWGVAVNRVGDNNNTISFNVPGGSTVKFIGLWSSAFGGVLRGMIPLNSAKSAIGIGVGGASDTITADLHNFSDGEVVRVFEGLDGVGVSGGLSIGDTDYYIISATADSFQLSATSGGVAIDLTNTKLMVFQQIIEETFNADGSLEISPGNLDLQLLGGSI